MSPEARALLSLPRLPAVVNVQEAAWLLGLQIHEIHLLTRSGHLKPLGRPRRGPKRFASVYIQTLAADSNWLGRSTDIIARHWRDKNHHSKEAEV
jgi:hypothetical protein